MGTPAPDLGNQPDKNENEPSIDTNTTESPADNDSADGQDSAAE